MLRYSCAESCWSESFQALIFSRRQTQQRSSSNGVGPAAPVQLPPHTLQRLFDKGRSTSNDFFAMARISGETIGSVNVFFFMAALTIKQIGRKFCHGGVL